MNETQYAELLIQGKITVPKERIMAALLAHQSIGSLQAQRFDPSRIPFYLELVENGKRTVLQKRAEAKQKEREIFRKRVSIYEVEIWKDLKNVFGWFNPRTNRIVELDGTLDEFTPAFLSGPTVSSDGVKTMSMPCALKRSGKIAIDLRPMLESFVHDIATTLARGNEKYKPIAVYKQLLLSHSSLVITCPLASPLVGPNLACSVFGSHSDKVLGCSELRLVLKEK